MKWYIMGYGRSDASSRQSQPIPILDPKMVKFVEVSLLLLLLIEIFLDIHQIEQLKVKRVSREKKAYSG